MEVRVVAGWCKRLFEDFLLGDLPRRKLPVLSLTNVDRVGVCPICAK